MADLVMDAPAKEVVGVVRPGDRGGTAAHHAGTGAEADADVVTGGVHKGVSEHPHVPDVVPGAGCLQGVALDAVGVVHQLHHFLPGQGVLVEGVHPVPGAQPGPCLAGGDGEEQMGQGYLGGVKVVGLEAIAQPRHIGVIVPVQLLDVIADAAPDGGLVQAVPVGQLQHRDGGAALHLQLDVTGPVPVVLQVEGTALLLGNVVDAGDGDDVAAVHQLLGGALPTGGLGIILGGHQGHLLPLGDLGVDDHLAARGGGDPQGLEGADPLGIAAGVPGLHLVHDVAQHRGIPLHQGLGHIQFLQQDILVDIVALGILRPGPQLVDLLLGDAGDDGGVGTVGEEGSDVVIDAVVGVEGHLGQGGVGLGSAVPLAHQHRYLLDVVVALKGKDGVAGLLGVVQQGGGGAVAGIVLQLPLIEGQVGLVAVLIPDGDGILGQGFRVALVQTGNIDHVVHALFLVELKGEAAAPSPRGGGPVGLKVPVVYPAYIEFAFIFGGYVSGTFHGDLGDGAVGDAVLGGQGGDDDLILLRLAGGGKGGLAVADLVARPHVEVVGNAVGQLLHREAGGGDGLGHPLELAGRRFLVVDVIELGVLRRLPVDGDGAVGGGEGEVIGGQRGLAGDGDAADHRRGVAGPVPVVGGDGEVVGGQVL